MKTQAQKTNPTHSGSLVGPATTDTTAETARAGLFSTILLPAARGRSSAQSMYHSVSIPSGKWFHAICACLLTGLAEVDLTAQTGPVLLAPITSKLLAPGVVFCQICITCDDNSFPKPHHPGAEGNRFQGQGPQEGNCCTKLTTKQWKCCLYWKPHSHPTSKTSWRLLVRRE